MVRRWPKPVAATQTERHSGEESREEKKRERKSRRTLKRAHPLIIATVPTVSSRLISRLAPKKCDRHANKGKCC